MLGCRFLSYTKEIEMNINERAHRIIATKRKNYRKMATMVPDKKASKDFHRPVYQAATLIRKQGDQIRSESVAEYIARKYDIRGDTNGDDDKGKIGSVPE